MTKLFLITSHLLFLTYISITPMQRELSQKKELWAYSSLIAITVGTISLTDQLYNNKKSLKQSTFTLGCWTTGIASLYNYLWWSNPNVYSYSHKINAIGLSERKFALNSYSYVRIVEYPTYYIIEDIKYSKNKFLSEEYEYCDGIIYNARGNIIEPDN